MFSTMKYNSNCIWVVNIFMFVLGITSITTGQEPRYCDNVDLSAFCILDNHFKAMIENATVVKYYPQFAEIVQDIFDKGPWIDDDEDPGFASDFPISNTSEPPRGLGKSVYSFQDMCDLKRVLFETNGVKPDQFARNPYHVEITEITVDGIHLHNHLHFRIFSNDAERDASTNGASGLIKYAFIIVHDKHGAAVGDFETGVPCGDDCACTNGTGCHQGEFEDTIPCMFTSSYAVTHPGQMMKYGGTTGLKEIHATWRYAQSTSIESFTDEIHVKTLLIEQANEITKKRDCRINYRFTNQYPWSNDSRQCSKENTIPCDSIPRTGKFGWTAQYNILWPTNQTLGAWDYFPRGFIKKKDVKCHNPLSQTRYFTEEYPSYDGLDANTLAGFPANCPFGNRFSIEFSGPNLITGALASLYSKLTWKPETQLYHGVPAESFLPAKHLHDLNQRPKPSGTPTFQHSRLPALKDIALEERCRCPRKGNPPLAPRETIPDVRQLEGRKDHAIQMTIAWIVLVPFAVFSSRFYKETYSKVFFLQEFWWYSFHVLSLILAAMFMVGGIYAIEIKRIDRFNFEDTNQLIHAIVGAIALAMFAFHLILGHQRMTKPELRRIQIFFHWFFGILEYFLSLFSMLNSSLIRAGCMSCPNFAFVIGWVVIQIAFYVVMEIHMRKIDKELHLVPRRSYLPPPVMRVFHINAPGCKFRIGMLVAYGICCVLAYGIMHYYIEFTKAYRSCFNFDLESEKKLVQFQPN